MIMVSTITAKHQAKESKIEMNENCAYEKPLHLSTIKVEANSAYGIVIIEHQ